MNTTARYIPLAPVFTELATLLGTTITQLTFALLQIQRADKTSMSVRHLTSTINVRLNGDNLPHIIFVEVKRLNENTVVCRVNVEFNDEKVLVNDVHAENLMEALSIRFGDVLECEHAGDSIIFSVPLLSIF